jgi:hypothetical protein
MVKHDDRRAAAILEQLHLASDYIDRTLSETHLCCAPRQSAPPMPYDGRFRHWLICQNG